MKRIIAPFGDGTVMLRPIKENDLETTLSWRNHDSSRIWFKTSAPLTITQHRTWFYRYLEKDNDFLFIVEVDGHPVGQASVYDIDWPQNAGEIGRFLIDAAAAGKGYIRAACKQLQCMCLKELGLQRLHLEVFENNLRAIRIYEDAGFAATARVDNLVRMEWRSQQT